MQTSRPSTVVHQDFRSWGRARRMAASTSELRPASSAVPQTLGGFTVYPSLVTSQAALTGHKVPVNAAAWVITPDTSRIGAGSLATLGTALQAGLATLTSAPGLHSATVTTGLPGLLAGLDRA